MGRVITTNALGMALAALLLTPLAGCQTPVDKHWGESVAALTEQQIQNPDAATEHPADPNAGIDGNSAAGALKEYRKPPAQRRRDRKAEPPIISIQRSD